MHVNIGFQEEGFLIDLMYEYSTICIHTHCNFQLVFYLTFFQRFSPGNEAKCYFFLISAW